VGIVRKKETRRSSGNEMIFRLIGYNHEGDEDHDLFYVEVDSSKKYFTSAIEKNPSEDLKTMLKQYHKKFPIVDLTKPQVADGWINPKSNFDWTGIWLTDQKQVVAIELNHCKLIDKKGNVMATWSGIIQSEGETPWGRLEKRKRGDEPGWPKLKKENK
jgi:hypothetical protein